MQYSAKVKSINPCTCEVEADLIININGVDLRVYTQVPTDFIDNYLQKHMVNVLVDLWLVFGTPTKIQEETKLFPKDLEVCGGVVKGKVLSVTNESELKVDCGIIIDIDSEDVISKDIKVGDYIEVQGTYQIFFNNTEYSRD